MLHNLNCKLQFTNIAKYTIHVCKPQHSLPRWTSSSLGPRDMKRLVEMLVHFKVMGGVDLDNYQDLSEAVEKAGLANLTSLMANVRVLVNHDCSH
jgi:hypothetical protein